MPLQVKPADICTNERPPHQIALAWTVWNHFVIPQPQDGGATAGHKGGITAPVVGMIADLEVAANARVRSDIEIEWPGDLAAQLVAGIDIERRSVGIDGRVGVVGEAGISVVAAAADARIATQRDLTRQDRLATKANGADAFLACSHA